MVVVRRGLIIALALGVVLTAAPRPARVVSLIPAVTEMLFAMGAGSDVIGVSSFDRFPGEVSSRQKVGGLLDPDTERILRLRPTLVVIYETQVELRDRLAAAGIPTWPYRHGSIASIYDTILGLGHALWNALPAVPAVRNHRIFEINDERLAVPGPRLPDGIRLFASLLHPDAVPQAASNPQAPQTPQ